MQVSDNYKDPPPGVTAREGRVDDFTKVMQLQKNVGFSGGLDFIPAVYRYWVHSKIGQIHLVEDKGKIVCKIYIRYLELIKLFEKVLKE